MGQFPKAGALLSSYLGIFDPGGHDLGHLAYLRFPEAHRKELGHQDFPGDEVGKRHAAEGAECPTDEIGGGRHSVDDGGWDAPGHQFQTNRTALGQSAVGHGENL